MASHTKPEYSKLYAELNHDKIVAAKKLDYIKNREKILARQKAWYKANPDKQRAIAKKSRDSRKEKAAAEQKAWRLANPEKVAATYAKRIANPDFKARRQRLKFGMEEGAYDAMLAAQDYKCAACRSDSPYSKNREKDRRWSVDHDHATGAVRGLLCSGCNLALGHVGDDVVKLQNLIDYLRRPLNGS